MIPIISPKYQMKLITEVEKKLWNLFPDKKYMNVLFYIEKWHEEDFDFNNHPRENFTIYKDERKNIDLLKTLNSIDGETLLKIAIDLGVETPDFIPSIPTFRNYIKSDYLTASTIFEKAFKDIENNPDTAIGLANSALESIVKEILNDKRITTEWNKGDTLYKLSSSLLKEFKIYPDAKIPEEIKTIGSSLLNACQAIERIRSTKTNFHGKTEEDYIVDNPMYAYFIVNSVCTVGLFLMSFYKKKFPKEKGNDDIPFDPDNLPF